MVSLLACGIPVQKAVFSVGGASTKPYVVLFGVNITIPLQMENQ